MASFSAKDIVGKTLFAKENLVAHSGSPWNISTFIINKGLRVGRVEGYIYKDTPNNAVYWKFYSRDGMLFYVRADKTKLVMDIVDAASIPTQEEMAAAIIEERKKKSDGLIPYYINKFGTPLATLGGALVVLQLIRNYGKKNN